MSTWVRTLLLWCVALAIPLQGMAAVVMPLCAALGSTQQTMPFMGHPLMASAAADQSNHAGHAMHADIAQALPDHPNGHDSGAPAADQDGHDCHSGHGMLKCCSSVGSLATMTRPALPARSALRAPTPLAVAAQLPAGVILDGLDRPPQSLLA